MTIFVVFEFIDIVEVGRRIIVLVVREYLLYV